MGGSLAGFRLDEGRNDVRRESKPFPWESNDRFHNASIR